MIEFFIIGFTRRVLPFVSNDRTVLKFVGTFYLRVAINGGFFINETSLNIFDDARYIHICLLIDLFHFFQGTENNWRNQDLLLSKLSQKFIINYPKEAKLFSQRLCFL